MFRISTWMACIDVVDDVLETIIELAISRKYHLRIQQWMSPLMWLDIAGILDELECDSNCRWFSSVRPVLPYEAFTPSRLSYTHTHARARARAYIQSGDSGLDLKPGASSRFACASTPDYHTLVIACHSWISKPITTTKLNDISLSTNSRRGSEHYSVRL